MNVEILKQELIAAEGLKLELYKDTLGLLSIGVGRNIQERGITLHEAMVMLDTDIELIQAELDKRIPWWRSLSDARQRALVNLGMMGIGSLMGFKNMLAALKAGDFERAAAEVLNSKWAGQVGDGGPSPTHPDGQRAYRVAKMMREG